MTPNSRPSSHIGSITLIAAFLALLVLLIFAPPPEAPDLDLEHRIEKTRRNLQSSLDKMRHE